MGNTIRPDAACPSNGPVRHGFYARDLPVQHNQYEYRIHYLQLEAGRGNEEQLVDALNAAGKDGWRLNRLYGEVSLRSITSWKGGLNLLLERETYE